MLRKSLDVIGAVGLWYWIALMVPPAWGASGDGAPSFRGRRGESW